MVNLAEQQQFKLPKFSVPKKKTITYAAKHLSSMRSRATRSTTSLGGVAGAKVRKMWGLEDSIKSILAGVPINDVLTALDV